MRSLLPINRKKALAITLSLMLGTGVFYAPLAEAVTVSNVTDNPTTKSVVTGASASGGSLNLTRENISVQNLDVGTINANDSALASAINVLTNDTTTGVINAKSAQIGSGGLTVGSTTYIDQNGLNGGGERITNVAAGTLDSDAVNLGQMKSADDAIFKIESTSTEGIITASGSAASYVDQKYQATLGTVEQQLAAMEPVVKYDVDAGGDKLDSVTLDNNANFKTGGTGNFGNLNVVNANADAITHF